jgi:hypothetical protein
MNTMKSLILLAIVCCVCLTPCRADLLIESFDGPVTPKEAAAFNEYMRGFTFRGDNNHNNFVYGNGGDAAESLGDMYEITQDREFLDQLIGVADKMLAGATIPKKA